MPATDVSAATVVISTTAGRGAITPATASRESARCAVPPDAVSATRGSTVAATAISAAKRGAVATARPTARGSVAAAAGASIAAAP